MGVCIYVPTSCMGASRSFSRLPFWYGALLPDAVFCLFVLNQKLLALLIPLIFLTKNINKVPASGTTCSARWEVGGGHSHLCSPPPRSSPPPPQEARVGASPGGVARVPSAPLRGPGSVLPPPSTSLGKCHFRGRPAACRPHVPPFCSLWGPSRMGWGCPWGPSSSVATRGNVSSMELVLTQVSSTMFLWFPLALGPHLCFPWS